MFTHYVDNFADDLGPEKIIHIFEPKSRLKAIVVIDNLSLGTAIGGCRMAQDVSTREVFRLARAMTLKNAVCGLPHGGGKSAILADPKSPIKEALVRSFAQAIRTLTDYVPGPDMGTDEQCMAYIKDEIGRAIGLPKVLGGIPLDELGMTGYGLSVAAEIACAEKGIDIKGARVAIQGFGNVGKAAAKHLAALGAKIVGVSDIQGAVMDPGGLDVAALTKVQLQGKSVAESGQGRKMERDDLLGIETDIFVPAARPDVFTVLNQNILKARLVLEGANIPITHEAAMKMHDRGILVIPDIIANSGGVICGATEYQGLLEVNAFERVRSTITRNTKELLERVRLEDLYPHDAAHNMARERILQAMAYRAHM